MDNIEFDYKSIESSQDNSKFFYELPKPVEIKGRNGIEIIDKVYYNGLSPVFKLTFEDDSEYEFTGSHQLLINRDNQEIFVRVKDLIEGDDVVDYFPTGA